MNKKKTIFSVLTILVLFISSIGIYTKYDTIKQDKITNTVYNKILYDIFDNIYPLSYQLDNTGKDATLPKYITSNEETTNHFYKNNISYSSKMMPKKKNIKYYAEGNNSSLSNTNDDIKNIQKNKDLKNKYQWYLKISFDDKGNFFFDTLGCQASSNQNYELTWNNFKQSNFKYLFDNDENTILHNPTNLDIYFAIPQIINHGSIDTIAYYSRQIGNNVENIIPFVTIAVVFVSLFILFYRYDTVKEIKLFQYFTKIKLELLFVILPFTFFIMIVIIHSLITDTLNGYYLSKLTSIGYSAYILDIINIIAWMVFLFFWMLSIYYLKTFFKGGVVNSLKTNTVISWVICLIKKLLNKVTSFDLNDNTNKTVLKIVLTNALIISIICCFFIFGIIFTLIYSAILFVILRIKFNEIKSDYQILLNSVRRLSNGDFDAEIYQDIGIFNSLKTEFTNIKNGFKKAVNEEVKSQKMKTELISNVSHDLKTPLTSIITYIDLLKDENLEPETRKEYINTLDRNSLRLKNLIDDLFEVSKVNSGDIKLNIVDVDIIALIQQAKFELTDKFNEKSLTFKTNYPEEKIVLSLDSLKTYRIFENLLMNISKYALKNTRVYIDVINHDKEVEVIFKNISSAEIKISENELVERFIQGDTSRNTSGSGLGLAIAKSFTELQKGTFKITVDGDLFKAIVVLKK